MFQNELKTEFEKSLGYCIGHFTYLYLFIVRMPGAAVAYCI